MRLCWFPHSKPVTRASVILDGMYVFTFLGRSWMTKLAVGLIVAAAIALVIFGVPYAMGVRALGAGVSARLPSGWTDVNGTFLSPDQTVEVTTLGSFYECGLNGGTQLTGGDLTLRGQGSYVDCHGYLWLDPNNGNWDLDIAPGPGLAYTPGQPTDYSTSLFISRLAAYHNDLEEILNSVSW